MNVDVSYFTPEIVASLRMKGVCLARSNIIELEMAKVTKELWRLAACMKTMKNNTYNL